MLRRQLDLAGLYECETLRWLPEVSETLATTFEVVIHFTPDCESEAIAKVGKGMAMELQQLLNCQKGSVSIALNCLSVVHSSLIDATGIQETQENPHNLVVN